MRNFVIATGAFALLAAIVPLGAGGASETDPVGDTVRTAAVDAVALGFEPGSGRLVAVGRRYTGSSYVVGVFWIDPQTAAVEQTLPLAFSPATAAFSDDGGVAYVAADSTIARVDLVARQVTQTFGAGTVPGSPEIAYTVGELSVPPGAHDTVVVARRVPLDSPLGYYRPDAYAGVAVFDAGVARAAASAGYDVPNEWFESLATDAGVAYVVTHASTRLRLRRIDIVPEGAFDAALSDTNDTTLGFYGPLHVASGRLLADDGGEADAATLAFLPRRWTPGEVEAIAGESSLTGAVFPDAGAGREYILDPPLLEMRSFPGGDWLGADRYEDSLMPSAGPNPNLLRFGEGLFAFSASGGVAIVETGFSARPTGLTATASADGPPPSSESVPPIALSWSDNCLDETSFTIERRRDLGAWAPAATLAADTTSWSDSLADDLVTGSTYDYRVRADRPQGPSAWTNVASASIREELSLDLLSGRIRDAGSQYLDSVVILGRLYRHRSDYDVDWHARQLGVELTIETGVSTIRASVPAGGPGWKRRTISGLEFDMYRSPRGDLPAIAFGISPRGHYVVFAAKGFDLAGPVSNPVSVHMRVGPNEFVMSRDWKPDHKTGLRTGRRISGL